MLVVLVVVVVMFMCEIRIVFNAVASVKHWAYIIQTGHTTRGLGRMVKYVEWFEVRRGGERECDCVRERAIERVNRVCCTIYGVSSNCVCQFSYQTNRNNFNKKSFRIHSFPLTQIFLIGSDAVETLSIRESNHKSSVG